MAAATALALVASPVAADVRRVDDADDAKGFLDIKRVAHRHGTGERLRHRITTFESWSDEDIQCAAMGVSFPKRHRYIRVFFDETLQAEMIDTAPVPTKVVGRVRVVRPNGRSIVVVFPKRLLGQSVSQYRWSALTETYGGACPPFEGDPPQFRDLAPNSGTILHSLD